LTNSFLNATNQTSSLANTGKVFVTLEKDFSRNLRHPPLKFTFDMRSLSMIETSFDQHNISFRAMS